MHTDGKYWCGIIAYTWATIGLLYISISYSWDNIYSYKYGIILCLDSSVYIDGNKPITIKYDIIL